MPQMVVRPCMARTMVEGGRIVKTVRHRQWTGHMAAGLMVLPQPDCHRRATPAGKSARRPVEM
jgi:hypothetical protein